MYHNLNIIKFSLVWILFSNYSLQAVCLYGSLHAIIIQSNNTIDTTHEILESTVESYYNTNIQTLLDEIDKIQVDIAKSVVHIRTLEKEANLDEKKLLFLLNKNKSQLHTIEEK